MPEAADGRNLYIDGVNNLFADNVKLVQRPVVGPQMVSLSLPDDQSVDKQEGLSPCQD